MELQILAVFLALAVIGIFLLIRDNAKWKAMYLEADSRPASKSVRVETKTDSAPKKTDSPKKSKAEKTEKSETKADSSKADKELQEAKEEIKQLKSKVYDLKGEVKELKVSESEAPKPIVGSDDLFELREELAKAKADAAEWKSKAESKRSEKPAKETPAPVVEAEPKADVKADSTGDTSKSEEALRRVQGQLENAKRDAQKAQDELEQFKQKMKKGGQSSEKQRRRADNNDRAYKITQRQLDIALERISYLEGKLADAGIAVASIEVPELAPAPRRQAPVVDVRDAVKEEEVAPEPEPKIEDAAPEAAPEAEEVAVEAPREEPKAEEGPKVAEPIVRSKTADPQPIEAPAPAPVEAAPAPEPAEAAPVSAPEPAPEAEVASTPEAAVEEDQGSTIKAKPVTQDDLDAAAPPVETHEEAPTERGNTAVLSGALAAAVAQETMGSEPDLSDDDGPQTSLLGSNAFAGFLKAADDAAASADETPEEKRTQFGIPGVIAEAPVEDDEASVDDAWGDLE